MAINPDLKNDNGFTELIKTLVSVIEEKDPFMKGHADRVAANCVLFARRLGLSKLEINQIYLAGLLHDIGIVYIPSDITLKAGPLTNDEMNMVKKHPLISEKILSKHSMLKGILPIIRHHHEFFDGNGYPDGLNGEEIPMGARIISIVNSFDAMTSARAHRPSMSIENALLEVEKNAGSQFDPDLSMDFIAFVRTLKTSPNKIDQQEQRKEEDLSQDIYDTEKNGSVKDILQSFVQKFKAGKVDLPVLSKVVQEIQKVMSNPSTTINEVAKVIEKDAVISVRLIAVANSPMYRGTEKIVTVKQAIPRLGVKETQSIVSAIANKSLYQARDIRFKVLMEKLWLHSLSTAYGARGIAKRVAPADTEIMFFMGLIHDIGKVLLFKILGESSSPKDMNDVIENVQEIHTSFGGTILRKWGFTENYVRIALLHEGPRFSDATDKDILIVNLANAISKKIGYSIFDQDDMELLHMDSLNLLEISPESVDRIAEETSSLMQEAGNIF